MANLGARRLNSVDIVFEPPESLPDMEFGLSKSEFRQCRTSALAQTRGNCDCRHCRKPIAVRNVQQLMSLIGSDGEHSN